MANYSNILAEIAATIKSNGTQAITGPVLQGVLLDMMSSLTVGYQFKGIATRNTNPGTPDQNVFYLATELGTYQNFGFTLEASGIYLFSYNGTWTMQQLVPLYYDLEVALVEESGLFFVDQALNVGARIDSDGLTAANMLTFEDD